MAACTFLTEDILIIIFTYLPLTSIYKFRSVSKVWLSILTNPYFITQWFKFNNKSLPWIQYHHTLCPPYDGIKSSRLSNAYHVLHSEFISRHDHGFSFRFINPNTKLYPIRSSNGLVLCSDLASQRRYYVCNPLTQKWVSIPTLPDREACELDLAGFFCEYSSSYKSPSSYKIIIIPKYLTPSRKFKVVVFCSKLGEWRTREVSCPQSVSWRRYSYYNFCGHDNVLYWIVGGNKIIAYNLIKNETDGCSCNFIYLPDEYRYSDEDYILGESEGLICYASISRRALSGWVLKENNWQLLYNDVDLHDIFVAMDSRIRGRKPKMSSAWLAQVLGFNPVDHYGILLGCWGYVWEFNVRTRRFQELCYPSLAYRLLDDSYMVRMPFMLKPMPTILPPPSWIDT